MRITGKSRDASTGLSLGNCKMVRGYEIRKMPLGKFFKALERLQNLPEEILAACFPGKTGSEVLDELSTLGVEDLSRYAAAAVMAFPEYAVKLAAEFAGIEPEALLEDETVGLDGFMEIVEAIIEVNRLGEALSAARSLWSRRFQTTGSKD